MHSFKIKNNTLYFIELIYITLPLFLFLFGWTKWYIAVVCCVAGGFCYKRTFCGITKNQDNGIKIKPWVLIIGCLLLLFVGFSCGWGRWVEQTSDYAKHNTILADLTNRSWPVYYRNGDEHSMLTYYIGQYIVPALAGKLFGSFRISEIALFVWSVTGIIIVWLHIINSLRVIHPAKQLSSIIVMVLFGPASYLAKQICFLIKLPLGIVIENSDWFFFNPSWGIHVQYSSNYTSLSWVFPQIIVCWITVLLLIDHKDDFKYYVPLMLPSMFYSVLSFLGILMLAIPYVIFVLIRKGSFTTWLKQLLSIENVLCASTVGGILIAYYWGNVSSEKPDSFDFYLSPIYFVPLLFLVFYITCVLPFPLCLMKWYFKDFFFVTSFVILVVLPLLHFGFVNDLMMRASVPAFFIMMYSFIDLFNKKLKTPSKLKKNIKTTEQNYLEIDNNHKKEGILVFLKRFINTDTLCMAIIIFFFIGGANFPVKNMINNLKHTHIPASSKLITWNSAETYANRSIKISSIDVLYNYYTYDIDDSFFYKYIARVQDTDSAESKNNE